MRYFTQRVDMAEAVEITADQARRFLEIYYKKDAIRDAIDNAKGFRLKTPYRDVWTKTDDGRVMMAGFYGIQ